MARVYPLAVGLAAVVACGLVHGVWTDRWALSDTPAVWAARLERVPSTLGPWEGRAWELDTQTLTVGQITGYLNRSYTRPGDATPVSLLLLCGRPGPISQHSPEVCMGGEGWEMTRKVRCSLQGEGLDKPAEFWSGVFRKQTGGVIAYRRVFWAWTSDGNWQAPDRPRLKYASRPALYKIYLIHALAHENEPLDKDSVHEFAGLLLPQLHKNLFSAGMRDER